MATLLHELAVYYTGPEWLIAPVVLLFLAGLMLRFGRNTSSCYFSGIAALSLLGFPSVFF
ncbi:MAG TPA: hypothetical protein VL574_01010 [Stellaceae bacterium]|jgi:hypothetical protein|nr:hypothetical protein [Stellaceae bacterium]